MYPPFFMKPVVGVPIPLDVEDELDQSQHPVIKP